MFKIRLNLKYMLLHGMMSLNYLMDHILLQTFKITLSISSKKYETLTNNYIVKIYVNKTTNYIVLKQKQGVQLFFNHKRAVRLLGRTKKI